jgi:two-component sensor histidine kinase
MMMDELVGFSHGGEDEVMAGFDNIVKRFDLLLEGGKHRKDDLEPLHDPYMRTLAGDIKVLLLGLMISTKEIFRKTDEEKNVALLEHNHNEMFGSFVRKTGMLEDRIERRLEQKERQSERFFWDIFAIWILVIMVSIAWLLRLEFKRTREEYDTKSSLKDRELYLKELNHRINNNLAIAQSMIGIQSRKTSDTKEKGVLNELENRIRTIGMSHRTLQTTIDLRHLNLSEYIRNIAAQLLSNYHVDSSRVNLKLDIDEKEADINDLTPYGLILNELITNAIKHAFPDDREGELLVSFKENEDGSQMLAVKDNGIGIPDGFDIHNSESMGMQIVTLLTEQVGGILEINKNGGTEFRITIKAKG